MELIVHISSGSVIASFVRLDSSAPTILATVTRVFDQNNTQDNNFDITSFTRVAGKAVSAALTELFSKNKVHVTSVLCVVGSPWVTCFGKTVPIHENREFVITDKFLRGVIDAEARTSAKEIEGQPKNSIEDIIEHESIGARIRGYLISDPIGQVTNECDISFFVSSIDKQFLEKISSSIHEAARIPMSKIIFHSAGLVSLSVIRNIWHPMDALHVHISGSSTDMQIISQDLLADVVAFPCGNQIFVQRLAVALDVSGNIAQSAWNIFNSGRANASLRDTCSRAITESIKEWQAYFESVTASIGAVPVKIFLTSDSISTEVFVKILEQQNHIVMHVDQSPILQDALFLTKHSE